MTAIVITFPTRQSDRECYQFQPVIYWWGWIPVFTWQPIKTSKSLNQT